MVKKFKVLLIYLLLFCLSPFAQVNKDSLWIIWKNEKLDDSTRLKSIDELAWSQIYVETDSAYKYALLQNVLAQKINNKIHVGKSLKTQGAYYYIKGDYQKALKHYFLSLDVFTGINNKEGMAANMSNIGIIYKSQGDLLRAINFFRSSLQLQEEINDKVRMANTQNNIGSVYQMQGEFDKAMEYFKLCEKTYTELGNKFGIAASMNNIGMIYSAQKKYDKALNVYNRSLDIRKLIDDKQGQAASLNNIGLVYQINGEFEQAIKFYEQSLLINSVYDKQVKSTTLNNMGTIFLLRENYDEALDYSLNALKYARELGSIKEIRDASMNLYKIYRKTDQFKKALEMHELFNEMQDSIVNDENLRALVDMKYEKEYQKQQDQIEVLEKQNEIEQLKQQKKESQLYFIIALLITGIALGFLIYLTNKKTIKEKIKLQRQRELLQTVIQTEEKERKRISEELHDGIGQMLTAVKMNLENVKNKIGSKAENEKLSEWQEDFLHSQKSVDIICNEVRSISHQMLPKALDIAGIVPALEELLLNFLNGTVIKYEFNHYGVNEVRFAENIELAIYRIVQEMLNNIVKHADASFISLQLLRNHKKLILILEDNGKGFNFEKTIKKHKGAGLSNINSRVQLINAKLNIETGQNKGTIATIRIPINGKN